MNQQIAIPASTTAWRRGEARAECPPVSNRADRANKPTLRPIKLFPKRRVRPSEAGSVAVEVGLMFPLVFVVMVGMFAFGQSLFVYNALQSSMRSAARYGSLAPYDLPNGTVWRQQVRNMAVYGSPTPPTGAVALAPGLMPVHVSLNLQIVDDRPRRLTVGIEGLEIDGLFRKFNVATPRVTFPFLGRVRRP